MDNYDKQVYPIGIPVAFGVMLWRKRRLINPPSDFSTGTATAFSEDRYSRRKDPDPRLLDRRIAQTAFLWGVSVLFVIFHGECLCQCHRCTYPDNWFSCKVKRGVFVLNSADNARTGDRFG